MLHRFWNVEVSSVSSRSICGSEEGETLSSVSSRNRSIVNGANVSDRPGSGGTSASIPKKLNLRNQPKVKVEAAEVSEPESGEILSDDSLSSVSLTKCV